MYIHRALEPLVRHYSDFFKVVVVTGPRQVGKTTMLKHLIEEDERKDIARNYVTLDDTSQLMIAKSDPALFLQRHRPPILIDEIQKAPELLPYIKMDVDQTDINGRYWLTGSQPFHLMKHVSESLAGRVGIIEMLGLSNAEIAKVQNEPFSPSSDYFQRRCTTMPGFGVNEAFERIVAGSFPGIRALPADLRASGYESYIDTYLMKDIRDLAHVVDELKFRHFMRACAVLTSRPVVYAELARIADIDEKTAKSWLSLLESSFIVKLINPYSNNLLKRLVKQPIMHFTDTGLAAYLAGWDNANALEMSAMGGQLFETFAFGELYKSYLNTGKRSPFHFFRNNDKREIDLLMEQNQTLYPIEVKKSASPAPADTKNFKAIDPVSSDDIPSDLAMFKRDIGIGTVICMTSDTYPLTQKAWAFPVWAI